MANQPDQPGPGQPRELNLQKMANQFMAGVQRHFDMLAFNLACRETASEAAYNAHVRSAGIMPVPQIHQNFEQMQAHARDLLLRQVINDSLNLTLTCLNNTHLFLALIKERKRSGSGDLTPEQQQNAQQAQQAFVKMPLEKKFDQLETQYGILCELEDSMISLAYCLQALMTQGGTVKPPQLDEQQRLQVELVTAANSLQSVHNLQPGNIQMETRAFREGERVSFSDSELLSIVLTVGVLAQQLFKSTADFARS
jgi:hypothetical protein